MPERSIIDAILLGAINSKWARDPEHPESEGSLTRFMTSLADAHPVEFISLFKKLIQADESSVEPQVETPADVRRLQ